MRECDRYAKYCWWLWLLMAGYQCTVVHVHWWSESDAAQQDGTGEMAVVIGTGEIISKKGSPYSITEHRVPELVPFLGSQPASDMRSWVGCHYFLPGLQLPLQLLRGLLPFSLLGEQRHDGCEQFAYDCYPTASWLRFEPAPFCAESSTLATRLPSHSNHKYCKQISPHCLRNICRLWLAMALMTILKIFAISIKCSLQSLFPT